MNYIIPAFAKFLSGCLMNFGSSLNKYKPNLIGIYEKVISIP
jgi:hypothetical protein